MAERQAPTSSQARSVNPWPAVNRRRADCWSRTDGILQLPRVRQPSDPARPDEPRNLRCVARFSLAVSAPGTGLPPPGDAGFLRELGVAHFSRRNDITGLP